MDGLACELRCHLVLLGHKLLVEALCSEVFYILYDNGDKVFVVVCEVEVRRIS
jgi:hypothetical protein